MKQLGAFVFLFFTWFDWISRTFLFLPHFVFNFEPPWRVGTTIHRWQCCLKSTAWFKNLFSNVTCDYFNCSFPIRKKTIIKFITLISHLKRNDRNGHCCRAKMRSPSRQRVHHSSRAVSISHYRVLAIRRHPYCPLITNGWEKCVVR